MNCFFCVALLLTFTANFLIACRANQYEQRKNQK